jgi:ribosome recycling factor
MSTAVQEILNQIEGKMAKSLDKLHQDFSTLRTGRATATLLDNVRVEYYGSQVPLKQVAAVAAPDGRTLEVRPWDAEALRAIEKGIQMADLGLNPNNDGKIIRIAIPMLTEERRKELVRVAKKIAEEFRITVRNDRREALEKIKKLEKEKALPEDQRKTGETALQNLTDSYVKKIDDTLAHKEKDILEV